jgi:hypothetical protein
MSGFSEPNFLTTEEFHPASFLVGVVVGKIVGAYERAYLDNKKGANLSLGDYFFRLSEAWKAAYTNEEAVQIANRTPFKLIDLKKAQASLDLVAMRKEYEAILSPVERISRRNDLSPGARRMALAKSLPKVPHSQILAWEEEQRTPANIAREIVAAEHGYRPSTLKRLLSQAKHFDEKEMLRRGWLERFNHSLNPFPLADIYRMTLFFRVFAYSSG